MIQRTLYPLRCAATPTKTLMDSTLPLKPSSLEETGQLGA